MSGISFDALLLAYSKNRMMQKQTTSMKRTYMMYRSIRIHRDQLGTPKFSQISSSGSTACLTVNHLFLKSFALRFSEIQQVKTEKNTLVMDQDQKAETALSTPSMDLNRTNAQTAWLSTPILFILLKYRLFNASICARYSSLLSLNFCVLISSNDSSNLWSIFSISQLIFLMPTTSSRYWQSDIANWMSMISQARSSSEFFSFSIICGYCLTIV